MGIFGKIVNTVINTATLPVAVAKDVLTLGGMSTWDGRGNGPTPYIVKKLEQIKREEE